MTLRKERFRAERIAQGLPVNPPKPPPPPIARVEDSYDNLGFPDDETLQKAKELNQTGNVILGEADRILKNIEEKKIYANAVRELAQQVYNARGSITFAEKMVIMIIAHAQVELYRRKLDETSKDQIIEQKESKIIYEGLTKLGLLNDPKTGVKPELEATKLLLNNMKFEEHLEKDKMYNKWKQEQEKIDSQMPKKEEM